MLKMRGRYLCSQGLLLWLWSNMKLVCYCHKYAEADIIDDLLVNNGRSSILEQITEEARNKTCQCDIYHPEKRWCLEDVRRVVDKFKKSKKI